MKTRVGLSVVTTVTVATIVVATAIGAVAQVDTVPTLPGSPTTTTTRPQTTTTAAPILPRIDADKPQGPVPTTAPSGPSAAKPAPAAAPGGVPVPDNGAGDSGVAPPGAGPFPDHLAALSRSVRRTGSRNTTALVDVLRQMEGYGVPREEAMRIGMGQFPVGGYATYSHDWWFPRFGPGWRLHQGTDIFAARGTPVRAPVDGVIRHAAGGLGGIAAYIVEETGTYFYLAHLDSRPKGQRDGQAVRMGDTVGYVGTSGNAEGGSAHLHFQYHPAVRLVTKGKGKRQTTVVVPIRVRPGTVLPAVDPKPFLDLSLQHAMANAGNLVATYKATHDAAQAAAAAGAPISPVEALPPGAASQLALQAPAQRSPTHTLARFQLAALAFVLILMVASLTPVLAPGRIPFGWPGRARRRRKAASGEPSPGTPVVAEALPTAGRDEPAPPGADGEAPGAAAPARRRSRRRRRRTGVAARKSRTPA